MKPFLLFLFTILSFSLTGQITTDPASAEMQGDPTEEELTQDFFVESAFASAQNALWRLSTQTDMPAGWDMYICDSNLCYDIGTTECPENNPNLINPGSSNKWSVYAVTNKLPGTVTIDVEIINRVDQDEVFYTFSTTFSNELSSTQNFGNEVNKIIYPNPTFDSFKISNDDNVATVKVFDLLGKQLISKSHTKGKSYTVDNLNKGLYLVRLLDNRNKVIRVLRLSKVTLQP